MKRDIDKLDVLFVNAMYFLDEDNINIGQFILRDILKNEYKVECLNFDYLYKTGEIKYKDSYDDNIELMGEYLIKKDAKILAFYTICDAFVYSLGIAKYVKDKNPQIKVIFGGPHASTIKEQCLKQFDFIDIVSYGESEKSFKSLIDDLLGKNKLSKVDCIVYRNDGGITVNNPAKLLLASELDNYVVEDFSPFKIDKNAIIDIEGGRGCPFNCTFCTTSIFWERNFRVKPVEDIIKEMKRYNDIFGVTKFSIIHDMFTANKRHIINFCQLLIEENLGFEWYCSSRIDVLDTELVGMLRDANCTKIFIGIESGSERMQKLLNKNLKLQDAYKMINFIKSKGIDVTISFVYGFKDVIVEDFKETIKMIEHFLKMGVKTIQLHKFMPLPNTVETNKIKDIMYFDRDNLDSTFNTIKNDSKIVEYIEKYPECFSQYYTFNSEVRNIYCYFDIFVAGMTLFNKNNNLCLRYIIDKIGIEKVFFDIKDVLPRWKKIIVEMISNTRESRKVTIIDIVKEDVLKYIEKKKDEPEIKYVKDLMLYCDYKYRYLKGDVDKESIVKFGINIGTVIKKNEFIEEEYYIKFSKWEW